MQSAQLESAQRSEALAARLAEQINAAEARIATARDSAMGALRQVSTETTEALLERLTGQSEKAAVGPAVDRALAARGLG